MASSYKRITRQQNADAGLRAIVFGADLIKLRDRCPGVARLAELQVRFGEQVQVLRLAGMLLDLLIQFGDIELRARLRRKLGTVVQIVKKMLIGIGPGGRILRERLKNIQISLRGSGLMEIPFRHRQFVVAVGGIAAHFHESAKQIDGLGEFLILDPQIRQFQERLGKIRIGAKRLLK